MSMISSTEQMIVELRELIEQQQQRINQLEERKSNSTNSESSTRHDPVSPVKPSTFHGDRRVSSVQVESWLLQLENYFRVMKIKDETERVDYAVSCLRDHATLWWHSALQREKKQQQDISWENFKTAVKLTYQPMAASHTARTALYSMRQTGPVQQYVELFTRHLHNVPDMNESDQVFLFLQGLKQHIAEEVSMHYPKSLHECMTLAQRAELNQRGMQRRRFVPYQRMEPLQQQQWINQGPVPMEVNAMEDGDDAEVYVMNGAGGMRTSGKDTRRCYNCQQTGHIARYCRATAGVTTSRTMANQYPKGSSRQ